MKIRTDFVTNSSSSSFSVVVSITDVDGNSYTFMEDPHEYNMDCGGTCYFNANIGNLLIKNAVENAVYAVKNAVKYIHEHNEKEYGLDDDGSDGRSTRIERVTKGERVSLAKIPRRTQSGYQDEDNYAIEVRSKEGSLGLLPSEALYRIKKVIDSDAVILKATVNRKRRKNGQYSLIYIVIDAEEKADAEEIVTNQILTKTTNQILTINSVSDLAKFLMDNVSDDYEKYDDWDDEEEEDIVDLDGFEQEIASRKETFISKVTQNISSINEIATISVDRNYSAWGE